MMEFDVNQLDQAGKRFFGRLGWRSGRSGIDMPPGVLDADAAAAGGVSFVLPEGKAKKPATEPKAKKRFLSTASKRSSRGGDHKKMSEGEKQACEVERAKHICDEWPEGWPRAR